MLDCNEEINDVELMEIGNLDLTQGTKLTNTTELPSENLIVNPVHSNALTAINTLKLKTLNLTFNKVVTETIKRSDYSDRHLVLHDCEIRI